MAAHTQQLNPTDRAILCVDRTLRSMGFPGFETQMLVYVGNRIDPDALAGALAHLSRKHPVVSSRLIEPQSGDPHWQFRPEGESPLVQVRLASSSDQEVLDCAARLLSDPCDPAQASPIRFYLLHRPDGRDVFLMQYNHTLMDNNAAVLLLKEIDRRARLGDDSPPVLSAPRGDAVWDYLHRFPRSRRRSASLAIARRWQEALRGGTATFTRFDAARPKTPKLCIATRWLDAEATRALAAHVTHVCGFPSLSMALVASAFRSLAPLSPDQPLGNRRLVAGIGIDLGLRTQRGPIFQNLMSLVPLQARPDELSNRDDLVQRLGCQLREQLAADIDLGVLQLTAIYSRRPRHAQWVIEHLLRYGFSLWYAYFGSLDAIGQHFCGSPIQQSFYTGPAWLPLGVTLIANQFRDRLLIQATYVSESVPDALVNQFLDSLVGDLRAI